LPEARLEPGPPGSPPAALRRYAHDAPRAVVVLVPGLGTNGRVWDLPDVGGLAGELWFEDLDVQIVQDLGAAPSLAGWELRLRGWLKAAASRHPDVPLVGIGHGLGGTALLGVATSEPGLLAGVVLIGSPLALRAPTRALLALLEQAGAGTTWARLLRRTWRGPRGPLGFEAPLLSGSLPRRTRAAFYRHALAPLQPGLVRSLAPWEPHGPLPRLVGRLAAGPALPLLVLTAPADGLWPPWMCDPAALGVRREGIRRVYLTRANGSRVEYNHLDLLLHREAPYDVVAPVMEWLDEVLEGH